jgi:hypothetical protein
MMMLRFENTMDDLFEFNLHHARTSPEMRKTIWKLSWGVGLTLFVLGLVVAAVTQDPKHLFLISGAGLLYVALYFAFFKSTLRKQVTRMFLEGRTASVLGIKTLQIDGDILLSASEASESRFKIASLQQIAETETYAFIYTGPMAAIIVPLARCSEGSPVEFLSLLRTKFSGDPAGPSE